MTSQTTKDTLLQTLRERTPKSGVFWEKSKNIVPGGLVSLARKFEPYPFYTERAEGPYIWDVDGNKYIDCTMGFGINILGHRPPDVVAAITKQLTKGLVYTTPHQLEIEYVERFIECVPCADSSILCNTGTEATLLGIRLMRAYTGKDKIAKFEGCYHGWHDYAAWSKMVFYDDLGPKDQPNAIPSAIGIPKAIKDTVMVLPFEESAFAMIEEHADELAGVMIEPFIGGGGIPLRTEFLQKLREVTERNGVLLMFDEVITGFRLALGGAQELHGVMPDLATYGKIIGGGLPAGAVGAQDFLTKTILESENMISNAGTFSGNPMTLAAGYAMMGHLMENRYLYDEMTVRGDRLRNGFNQWAGEKGYPAQMTGQVSLYQSHLKSEPITKPRELLGQPMDAISELQLQLRVNGLFIPFFHLAFISAAHSDEIVEEILQIHKVSVEAVLESHELI